MNIPWKAIASTKSGRVLSRRGTVAGAAFKSNRRRVISRTQRARYCRIEGLDTSLTRMLTTLLSRHARSSV